jgi:hypothetical protein
MKKNGFIKFINSRITRLAGTTVLLAGAFTGIGFGFAQYNSNELNPTSEYKSKLETSINIDREVTDNTNPYVIAAELVSTLE